MRVRAQTDVAVYGTLRRGDRNHDLLARASFLGTGAIEGSLYHVPMARHRPYGYPALLLDGAGRVSVEVYRLDDPATLAALDQLEGYDPASEPGCEYVRRRVAIHDGPVSDAWVYVYLGSPAELAERIADGDWIAFSTRRRPRAGPPPRRA